MDDKNKKKKNDVWVAYVFAFVVIPAAIIYMYYSVFTAPDYEYGWSHVGVDAELEWQDLRTWNRLSKAGLIIGPFVLLYYLFRKKK